MPKQTKYELKKHLKEQIGFLRRSAESYDEGYKSEAKRLAVIIRVLLHDTGSSSSLLKQLDKKNIMFYDTALEYDPKNLISTLGLIMMKHGPDGGEYVPPLNFGPPSRYIKGKVPFDDWWNKIVFVDKNKNIMTRKQLITNVCNKDGGSHIDPNLNKTYADITRNNSLGFNYVLNGVRGDMEDSELASVRQIAYEVLKSLEDEFPEYF